MAVATFRERLIRFRKSRGLTSDQFGKLIGVSGSAVRNWERDDYHLPNVQIYPRLEEIGLPVIEDEADAMPTVRERRKVYDEISLFDLALSVLVSSGTTEQERRMAEATIRAILSGALKKSHDD